PLYMSLVKAIADDIEAGRLPKGSRLPTHRELADELKVAIGTITRAYDEAERRGLIYGDGRRGTYVGELPRPKSLLASLSKGFSMGIDLSKNHPAYAYDPALTEAVRKISRRTDCGHLLEYPPAAGFPEHRRAAAGWIESLGLKADPENLFISGGAQHGLMSAFAAEARPGDIIATEEYSYPGVKAAADILGLQQVGVAIDDEGIIPDALDAVCRKKDVRLLYCNPTFQNPTNAVMSLERMKQIAAVAEKYNLTIIEDEILSPFMDSNHGFIAGLIPDRTYFVISSSKAIAAGLRVGFIVAPVRSRQKLSEAIQGISLGLPPLMAEIFTQWYENGIIEKTIARRKREIAVSQQIAQKILGGYDIKSHSSSYHVWLKLPENWTSLDFAVETQMRGVAVAPAEIFAVDPKSSLDAVRISVGSAPNHDILKTGLEIIADVLSGPKRAGVVTV
ncbi:MAG: PLP-dependent aminotransferase family protein, partial [Candidatus Zixiibacteriota bacterium]